jgi:hypothetical protein
MKKNIKKSETVHARVSPSTFKSREICPSYVPDEETTKAAERGTLLHRLLQDHGYKATRAKAAKDLEEADELQLAMVCDYIKPYENQCAVNGGKIVREHRFNLLPLHIFDCNGGTGDLLLLDKKRKHIDLMDYKFGWIEVDDAADNIQLALYVIGAFSENPWAESVMAHILQPARDEVSTHLFQRSDMNAALLRARTIADRVRKLAGKEFNPVVDNCLWCDNKATCLALHALVLKVADGAKLEVPDGLLTPEDFNDVANAGALYDFAEILIKYGQAVKWKIITLNMDGHEIPGHELRETAGKRSIVDPQGVQELLEKTYGVSLEEFLTISSPSITAAQALAAKKAEYGEKEKTSQEFAAACLRAGLVATGNPSRFLVRIKTKADKRSK